MENLTYEYTVTSISLIDKEDYTDVVDLIYYTITATHPDGRTASIDDSFKVNSDNLGYVTFAESSTLTNSMMKGWLTRGIANTYQETENKNELERLIRSQAIPGGRVITF